MIKFPMRVFNYFLFFISSILIISCDKDQSEIIPKDEVLNNVETKYVLNYTKSVTETTDTLFIQYYYSNKNENVFDTIVNQTSWESPIIKMNSGDSSYCKVRVKTYSTNNDITTNIDLKFTTIENNINVFIPEGAYSGESSNKITYSDKTVLIDSYKFYGAKYKFVKK